MEFSGVELCTHTGENLFLRKLDKSNSERENRVKTSLTHETSIPTEMYRLDRPPEFLVS